MDRETINHAQWECQQLLNRVNLLMDSARWEELAACYTEDATLIRPSDPFNGVEGRQSILASFKARQPRTSCHMLANSVFEVQTPEQVIATSRVWLITGEPTDRRPAQADNKLMVGTFVDLLVRVDGRWFIRQRRGSIELKYG